MVVRQDDADHGSATSTHVPVSGIERSTSCPPAASARSRMLTSPRESGGHVPDESNPRPSSVTDRRGPARSSTRTELAWP